MFIVDGFLGLLKLRRRTSVVLSFTFFIIYCETSMNLRSLCETYHLKCSEFESKKKMSLETNLGLCNSNEKHMLVNVNAPLNVFEFL